MKKDESSLRMAIRKIIAEMTDIAPNVSTSDKLNNLRAYIRDNIDVSHYDEYANTPESGKLQAAIDIFKEEKGWDIERQGLRKAFIDWVRGMPSILDVATYYDEIKNLLYALGYDEVEGMDDPEVDKLYYNELFKAFFNR